MNQDMDVRPVFSVCIATYHQDAYIEICVRSVLAQMSDVPIEILIGDDGDSPLTPGIVERLSDEHPGCIQYFRHPQNLGASANYQFLVERAKGEYIAHLDGDDFWLPGKLKAQWQVLRSSPEVVACYTNAVVVDDDLAPKALFTSCATQRLDLAFMLAEGNFLNHSSMVYRSSSKGAVLGIQGPFIDYAIHLRLAQKGELYLLPGAYVAYRWATQHSMLQRTPSKVQQWYWEAMRSVLDSPATSSHTRRTALAHYWGMAVTEALIKGKVGWTRHWHKELSLAFPDDFRSVYWRGWRFAFRRAIRLSLAALGRRLARPVVRVLHPR